MNVERFQAQIEQLHESEIRRIAHRLFRRVMDIESAGRTAPESAYIQHGRLRLLAQERYDARMEARRVHWM